MSSGPDTQLFRDVFNASPIGIAVENLEGQPLFVNPAFCAMLGFNEEELRNKHCADFSPPGDAEKDWALFQQLRAGSIDHYQLEKRYFRRDGSLVWGRLSISLLTSGPSPLVLAMVEDISEKKAAEETRFKHAAIVESSEDAIISEDLGGLITSWNAGAERIFEYAEAEVVGQAITILIPPERRDEENRILHRLRSGGRLEHYETKRVTKTGKNVDISLTICPIKDASGSVVGFTKIAHDITQRKQAEEAVKESEARFRLVADTAPVLIWMSGTNKLRNYFNKPWHDFTGRPIEQELRNGWAEGVHADDWRRCLNTYTESFDRRENLRMEYRLRRYDGAYRWVLDMGVPRFNPDRSFAGYIGIAIDVTERKIAEEGLRELNRALEEQTILLQSREELLNIFVQNVPAGVAMLDRDMRYLQVSDRWCADYAIERSQILGRSHYEVFPDIPPRWKEMHQRGLAGETLRAEEDGWDRQGGTTWVRWEIRPWKTATGNVGGILIFAEDITRRKQMEEAFSAVSRKLIESQEQERTRIARELHDDINQQLALLAVELDRWGQDVPSGASAEFHTHIRHAVERITSISKDVQSLSHRLHSSKLEYLGLARAAKSFCNEVSEQGNVEIVFNSAGSLVGLPYDVSLCVFRVLQEALQNAVKHSRVRSFQVELRGTANSVEMTVMDHGVGFEQQDPSNHHGLGLISMRERSLLVNGELSIKSSIGGGTVIRLFVPLAYVQHGQRLVA